jgi:hypothetical protein
MAEKLQIKIEFNRIEDRLLLRISEGTGLACTEYRLWLTRRFVGFFIKAVDKLVEEALAKDMLLSPEALEAMKKFQQEAALARADFSCSYDLGAENCALMAEPPIKKKETAMYVLSFLTSENAGVHLTASMDLIHSLRKILVDSVRNAGWTQPVLEAVNQVEKSTGQGTLVS